MPRNNYDVTMVDRTSPLPVTTLCSEPMPSVRHQRLDNGIELVTLDSMNVEDVTRLTLSWNNGGYDSQYPPVADIATQLSRTGSKRLTPDATADLFDYNGGWITAELMGHNNTMTLFSLNRTLRPLLDAVVDMVNQPVLAEKEFITIREKLAAQRATQLERVQYQAEILDLQQCFGENHPITRQYTPQYIREITLEQVANELESLRSKQCPVAYLTGRLTPQVMNTVEKALSDIACDPLDNGHVKVIASNPCKVDSRRHHCMEHAQQSAIRISIPTIPRNHPDYEMLRIAVKALGGYFGSRLMTNIREEKGLTYGINAGVYGYREGAFISISSQCDNRYVDRVIEETLKEIDQLATTPMTPDELNELKQVSTASLLTTLDTPFSIMDYHMLERHILTPVDYFQRQQKSIASVTPEKICDITSQYLTGKAILISTSGAYC
ncbi:MAG: insulinase family protein [Clostridiales bacterium]|nr:insulinase family protein [Clostridiales bacterium]